MWSIPGGAVAGSTSCPPRLLPCHRRDQKRKTEGQAISWVPVTRVVSRWTGILVDGVSWGCHHRSNKCGDGAVSSAIGDGADINPISEVDGVGVGDGDGVDAGAGPLEAWCVEGWCVVGSAATAEVAGDVAEPRAVGAGSGKRSAPC